MPLLGIKFAPFNVPLERRLQTLAAATLVTILAVGEMFAILIPLYLIIYTRLWWITILYLAWIFVIDRNTCEQGGRTREWLQSGWFWEYFKNYFPIQLQRLPFVNLDPKRNYLFCCFPHGMIPMGSFVAFNTNAAGFRNCFPEHKRYICTLGQHFYFPFFREFLFALGFCSSSAKSLNYVLGKPEGGNIAVLVVGGAAEAYYCKPGMYKLVLKNRKGFVKLALKNGAALVPVFSFGETSLYTQIDNGDNSKLKQFQEKLRQWIGIAPIFPIGRGIFQYTFGLIPNRHPISVIVGKPIDIEKTENPTKEQVDATHQKFIQSLVVMFENQKQYYLQDHENTHLEII